MENSRILDDFYAKGYAVCDHFIDQPDVSTFVEKIISERENLKKAGIGSGSDKQINENIRGDYIRWIEKNESPFSEAYFNKLLPVIESFNRRFYLGIGNSEHHIAYYPPGTRYEKHVDTFKNSDARVVSSVLYLNLNWKPEDGGELRLFSESGESITVAPLAGRLLLFESTLPHEVLLSHAPRYSITGWFKRNSVL